MRPARILPLTLVLSAACAAPGDDPGAPDAGALEPEPDAMPLPPLGAGLVTLAGGAKPGMVDGPRDVAQFANPVNVTALADGAVLVCDFDNGQLRRVDADGTTTTIVQPPPGFARPFGAVRDGDVVWIQTDRNAAGMPGGALWKLELGGDAASLSLIRDDFGRYRGLAVREDGKLVLADQLRHIVDVLDPDTGTVMRLAGAPDVAGDVDAAGGAARFDTPIDVIALPGGDVLVADFGNGKLRRVSPGGAVTTFADGLTTPQGLARGADGTIYVSDPDAGVVHRLSGDGMATLAGTGEPGHADDADPLAGQLFGLEGIDVSDDGAYLFVADGSRGEELPYHFVRRISL